jgi:hypothetical protein
MELVEMIVGCMNMKAWFYRTSGCSAAEARRSVGQPRGELENTTLHLQLPCTLCLTKIQAELQLKANSKGCQVDSQRSSRFRQCLLSCVSGGSGVATDRIVTYDV